MNGAEQYIHDVTHNKIVTCDFVKLAVERHLAGLEKSKKGDWEWVFDRESAEHAINCIRLFRHTKGREFARRPFMLQNYQEFILWELFGWIHQDPIVDEEFGDINVRRFVKAYIETAKKSGKSEFAAAILLYGLLFDGEYGAQCHSAATKRDQAMYVFTPARTMAKFLKADSPDLSKMIGIHTHRVFVTETESFLSPLSSDYDSLDGVDAYFTVLDEYHAHKTSGLNDNLENSSVNRLNPLHLQITTAGFNLNYPCYQFRRNVVAPVLKGVKTDDRLFAIVYTLDDGDDWEDESVWIKPNPGIGHTPKWDKIRKLYTAAKNAGGTKIVDFKTKNLNIWVPASSEFIPDKIWMKGQEQDMTYADIRERLRGQKCVGGLDLAQSRDICALILYFPEVEDGRVHILSHFWCNQEQAKIRQANGDPYEDWGRSKHLNLTDGDFTDYDYIKNEILEAHRIFDLLSIAYDPALAKDFVRRLEDEGLEMNPHSQSFAEMNGPTREIEDMGREGTLQHYGHPVLRWMNGNVNIRRNADGHIKIDKSSDAQKVDGMVALVMSRSEWVYQESLYVSDVMRTI